MDYGLLNKEKSNIVLIGMPGVGKSTVGVLLAKQLAKQFVDTDLVLQHKQKMALQDIMDRFGYLRLREVEEGVICSLRRRNAVIATGGSAVYSARAMEHLGKNGVVIYLQSGIKDVLARITNYATRGIAKSPEQSFEALFEERTQLYEKYAVATVKCQKASPEEVAGKIIRLIFV